MQPIASAPMVRRLLQELKFSPNKLLGQNFLICEGVAERIVRSVGAIKGDKVLEIGPGLGALSEPLAADIDFLTLVELDGLLCAHLRRLFAANERVEVILADGLSFDYASYATDKRWGDYLIVANLPYGITSPLIQYLLLNGGSWRSLTLMMQLEVAHKLLPASEGQASGPLNLLAQYFGNISLLFTVEKECFFPVPQVESAVVQIVRHIRPPFAINDQERFARFLNAAFSHRRKTLVNSLNNSLAGGADFWRQALSLCGVEQNKRAEQLALADYVALFALPQVRKYLP